LQYLFRNCCQTLPNPALLFQLHLLQRISLTPSIRPSVFPFTSCHYIYVLELNPLMRPRLFIPSSIGTFLPLLNWMSNCYIPSIFWREHHIIYLLICILTSYNISYRHMSLSKTLQNRIL
jgi:hypothetical protein